MLKTMLPKVGPLIGIQWGWSCEWGKQRFEPGRWRRRWIPHQGLESFDSFVICDWWSHTWDHYPALETTWAEVFFRNSEGNRWIQIPKKGFVFWFWFCIQQQLLQTRLKSYRVPLFNCVLAVFGLFLQTLSWCWSVEASLSLSSSLQNTENLETTTAERTCCGPVSPGASLNQPPTLDCCIYYHLSDCVQTCGGASSCCRWCLWLWSCLAPSSGSAPASAEASRPRSASESSTC